MESVRRVDFTKKYFLPAIAVLIVFSFWVAKGLPLEITNILGFGLIYIAILFLQHPTYYVICRLWNPISPIKNNNILETTLVRLTTYGLIILPSIIFFAKGNEIVSFQIMMLTILLILPISLIWTCMNNYVNSLSQYLKSADFREWRP